LIGAIPISIVEAIHRHPTRVLTIAIAVKLQNIAIGIIPESFGIVVGSVGIRLRSITHKTARGSAKCMLAGIEQAVEMHV
jgi:hypothetical protein